MSEQGIRFKFTGDATGLESSAKKASAALGKVRTSTGSAALALSNFGRIVQDAPYGFIGFANNIEPFIQSLGNMKGGVKSLALAFAGPAGMLFAVSAVSSVIQGLILKYGSLSKALDVLLTSNDAAVISQKELTASFADAEGKAAGEISKLNALVSIAQNLNQPTKARQQAISAINKEYDKYLPNLTLENIKSQEVLIAIEKLNTALIRQAKIKGVQDLISKESGRLLELQTGAVQENLKWYDYLTTGLQGFNVAGAQVQKGFQRTNEALDKSNQKLSIFDTALRNLLSDDAAAGTLFVDPKKIIKTPKHKLSLSDLFTIVNANSDEDFLKFREDAAKSLNKMMDDTAKENSGFFAKLFMHTPVTEQGRNLADKILPTTEDMQVVFAGRIQEVLNNFSKMGIKAPDVSFLSDLGAQLSVLTEAGNKAKEFRDTITGVAQAITRDLGGAFQGLFEGILSGSQSAFQAFAQALGNIIKKLIATAAASALLTAFLGPLGLIKDVASPFSLKGIAAFKQLFSQLGGFAEGGVSTGPQSGYLAKLHGTEVITPINKFMDLMVGNGGNRGFIAETVISGNDLRILVREADRRAGRLF